MFGRTKKIWSLSDEDPRTKFSSLGPRSWVDVGRYLRYRRSNDEISRKMITDSVAQGFPFEKKITIHLDGCIAAKDDPPHFRPDHPSLFAAHTHICPKEKNFKTVCIFASMIKEVDGSPSDVMWHEYAHVLDVNDMEWPVEIDCSGGIERHGFTYADITINQEFKDFLDTNGHGESWRAIMRKLGRVPSLWANPPKGLNL